MSRRLQTLAVLLVFVMMTAVPAIHANQQGKHSQAGAGCTCHGSATTTVIPQHNFPAQWQAGFIYSINISYTGGSQQNGAGFNVEVSAGALQSAGNGVSLSGNPATSATHTSPGQFIWSFEWMAPNPNSGNAVIDIAIVDTNGNGQNSGDAWNNLQVTIPEQLPPNTAPTASNPAISPSPEAGVNQSLTLTYTFSDPENDAESGSQIHWFVDGSHVTAHNNKKVIDATHTQVGQSWMAEITPSDGQAQGAMIETGNVTIVDIDSDGDGVLDGQDRFPNDATQTDDADGDGYGDNPDGNNADAFPSDSSEWADSDDDGVGDNADAFPNDPTETTDSDGDNVGDNADAFPNDGSETADSDDDGVGDNADAFPNDPTETTDSDGDNVGDNADAFPDNAAESADTDMDGVGDNADDFPQDANETTDSDDDGVGDNADAFPNDPFESADSDDDGVGDNADAFPNDASEIADRDNDGVGDNTDAFPEDGTESVDTDMDGVGDNGDAFPNDASQTTDRDGDGYGDNIQGTNPDRFPDVRTQWADADGDGYGDNPNGTNADAFPADPFEWVDSDMDGVGDNSDAFPNDASETADTDGDGMGDNEQKILEDRLAAEAADEEAAQQRTVTIVVVLVLLLGGGVAFFVVRGRSTEDEVKTFDAVASAVQPPAGFNPNAGASSTPAGYPTAAASTVVAQPAMTQAVDDSALNALAEPEPVAPAKPEPSVVNQWTDETGHTWRVMSDGTNRWWNGTDWQKV
jgi:hypothetical protein